jgi:fatty-acyl-CoA synthase
MGSITHSNLAKDEVIVMNGRLEDELLVKSMNVGWWVQRWSELHPKKNAILYGEEQISYFELQQKTNLTSYWLKSMGIKKGDRVAIMLNNCPEFVELYLSCAKLVVIFVPFNTHTLHQAIKTRELRF